VPGNLYTLDGYQIDLDYLDDGKISMIEDILLDLRSNNRGKGIIDVKHDTPVFRLY
jgi:cell division protein FtsQ